MTLTPRQVYFGVGGTDDAHPTEKAEIVELLEGMERVSADAIAAEAAARIAGDQAEEQAREVALATQDGKIGSLESTVFVNAQVYDDMPAGLGATTEGQQFQVVDGDDIVRYRHDAGPVATELARQPTSASLAAAAAVAGSDQSGDVWHVQDVAGQAPLRIDRHGALIVPGMPQGVQRSIAGASVFRAVEAEIFAASEGEKLYWQDRGRHEHGLPLCNDFLIASNQHMGTKLQRIPDAKLVRPGRLIVFWQQINTAAPNSDTQGVRYVYRFIDFDVDTFDVISMSDTEVFDTPPGWSEGNGLAHHGHCAVIDESTFVVVYNYGTSSTTRDLVYRRSTDGGETWGARQTISVYDGPKGMVVTGSNGTLARLRAGPNAGRWLIPVYYLDGTLSNAAVLYSDDNGVSWAFAPTFSTSGDEWALALRYDGTLIGSVRKAGAHRRVASTDGGTTWTAEDLPDALWGHFQNNRCMVEASYGIGEGIPKILWCSTLPLAGEAGVSFGRSGLGIRVSYDGLITPHHEYRLFPRSRPSGYSSIARVAEDVFFIAYETGYNNQPNSIRGRFINMSEIFQNGYRR